MKWISLLLMVALACQGQTADLVLRNGKIWTGKGTTNALAIVGKKIVATGDAALKLQSKRTIELGGRFAMPGFNDAHIHFLEGSLGLTKVDLTGICTLPAIQKAIVDFAKAHPNAPWITGGGWEYTCFPNLRMPTKEDIDAVLADRPVFLEAYDGHTAWANSKALRISEVENTPFSGFGEVVKDAAGKPTGVLKESAQSLVARHVPKATLEEKRAALAQGMKLAASLGITSIQNAARGAEDLPLYLELLNQNKLTLRVSLALSAGPTTDFTKLSKMQSSLLSVRAVKFFLDGVIESHTAAMLTNYEDGTNSKGPTSMTPEQYSKAVERADKAGWQIYTHAIGDRAVRLALDAYEGAARTNGKRDARHRIEHIEVLHPDDLPRFAKLGVLPVMQPIHAYPSTIEVWAKAVGPKRLELAFPWKSLADTGARVTFSSDWPACISLNPIRGLHNAVNRRTIEGKPEGGWTPAQRVSLEYALRAYTQGGAYASFEESQKGELAAGQWADVVILSADPFAMPTQDLHKLKVETTIFNGKVVYQK